MDEAIFYFYQDFLECGLMFKVSRGKIMYKNKAFISWEVEDERSLYGRFLYGKDYIVEKEQ